MPQEADLAASDASDSPVGVVLGFEGDRSRWTPRTHRLSEMTRLLTGEELPFATLMYVWGNKEAPGTVVVNPRTDRIRKLVLDSDVATVGQWRDHVRDVRADYTAEQAIADNADALLDRVDRCLTYGAMPAAMRQEIRTAVNAISVSTTTGRTPSNRDGGW